ncbi:MAG: hypothetical protein IJ638_00965 [Alphaproteobacteria bacterium]|nr:hypothetical protein [Alphaproteobacteria bacterium]
MSDDIFDAFLSGYDVLKIPVIENGKSVWAEKFPLEKIEQLKKSVGVKKFSAQMMLCPVDITEGRFDVNKLCFYNAEIKREERNRELCFSIMGKRIISASCWWDPAYGSKNGDGSVVSIVFIDEDGRYYLHDVEYLYFKDGADIQSARDQCQSVGLFLKRNFVPAINVESNGIGKFLPEFLRSELEKMGINAVVTAKTSKVSKELRILDAFDAIISAGYLLVNESVKNTPFMGEFTDWNVDSRVHDDGLDSVAGAILAEPVKMPAVIGGRIGSVRKLPNMPFRIRTDFKI